MAGNIHLIQKPSMLKAIGIKSVVLEFVQIGLEDQDLRMVGLVPMIYMLK